MLPLRAMEMAEGSMFQTLCWSTWQRGWLGVGSGLKQGQFEGQTVPAILMHPLSNGLAQLYFD